MIIQSLLDTDLYKFTMMQVVLHHFPGAQVEYRFRCRTPGANLAPCVQEIREEIRALCSLKLQDAELDYLGSMRFIKSDFVDFLGLFRLNENTSTSRRCPMARSTSPSSAPGCTPFSLRFRCSPSSTRSTSAGSTPGRTTKRAESALKSR